MVRILFVFVVLQFAFLAGARGQASQNEAEPSVDAFVDVDQEPRPVQSIESNLQYPEAARRAGIEGKVLAAMLIERDGTVSKVTVERSDNDLLRDAAVLACKQARFTPAMQNGKPIRIWVERVINFKLTQPGETDAPAAPAANHPSTAHPATADSTRGSR